MENICANTLRHFIRVDWFNMSKYFHEVMLYIFYPYRLGGSIVGPSIGYLGGGALIDLYVDFPEPPPV